jgi:hypothetical protein
MSAVDHPAHYGGAENPFEVIKVLEAWLTPQEFHGFLRGNVLKYEARAKDKGGIEDYRKAAWYQQRLIEHAAEHGLDVIFPKPKALFWNDAGMLFEAAAEVVEDADFNAVVTIHSSVEPHVQWGVRPCYDDEDIVELFSTRAKAEAYLSDFIAATKQQREGEDDGA